MNNQELSLLRAYSNFSLPPSTFTHDHRQCSGPLANNRIKNDPANYYGVTVANGIIGIVSSPELFKVKGVVLYAEWINSGRSDVWKSGPRIVNDIGCWR